MLATPWWVFILIAFIIISGYMAFRTMRAEKRLEQHFIEREGEIFMERIRQEKAKRTERSSN